MSDGQGSASGVCCLYFFRHRALHYAFGDGEASVFVGYAAEAGAICADYTTYLHALMKMIGITYVGQFSAGLCKDAGYSAIAGQIEIFSKLSILAISMPILMALMDTIQGFLS